MVSTRSSASAPMPIIYEDMFYKQTGQHPTATQQFYDLAGALADYIVTDIGNRNDGKLSPQKLADFYRTVSGEARWDTFWLETNPTALSDIFRTIGSFHSLEPTQNPYEAPSIPTLTRDGFVRWILLQVLLSPQDNVKNLQYAVKHFHLKHPATGQEFPRNLPAFVFPDTPDPEVTEWHERCGQRLKSRFEERKRHQEHSAARPPGSAEPSPRYAESPRNRNHKDRHSDRERGRDTNARTNGQPSTSTSAAAGATAAAAASYLRGHTRSTSASLPREHQISVDDRHTHSRMRSFDKTPPRQDPRDRTRVDAYSTDSSPDTAAPKYAHAYVGSPPKAYASVNIPAGGLRPDRMTPPRDLRERDRERLEREFRRAPSPHLDGSTRAARKRPAMLRHLSANVPVFRAPFSPGSSSSRGGSYTSDNEERGPSNSTSPRSPRSPRYPLSGHHGTPRRRSEHISRVLDDEGSPASTGTTSTSSGAHSPGNPKIHVSVDTSVGGISRQPPFVVSPASPRSRPPYHASPIEEKEGSIYGVSHGYSSGKRRSGVIALGESFLNMFSSNSDRSRESSRDRETRLREREWRTGSRDRLDRLDRGVGAGTARNGRVRARESAEVEDDISEEEEETTPTGGSFRHGRRERERGRGEREYERERRGLGRRYEDGPPRVSATRAEASTRSKSHADMDRPRARPNSVYY